MTRYREILSTNNLLCHGYKLFCIIPYSKIINTYIYLVAANAEKDTNTITFKDINEITPHILGSTTKGDNGYANDNILFYLFET